MAKFPRIDSPCPLSVGQLPTFGNFHCSHCHKQVHDISQMTDEQRLAFLKACTGDICVSYNLKKRVLHTARVSALVAGTFVAGAVLPAVAQDILDEDLTELIVVGGIKDAKHAPLVDDKQLQNEQVPLDRIPVLIIEETTDEKDA